MTILDGNDPAAVHHAADLLARGEQVAFPTETVYGLGARADDDAAVARIFATKGRPMGHPLIVHLADVAAADVFSPGLGQDAARLAAAFWPGPLTVIVRRRPGIATAAAGGQDSIGLRIPAHPVAQRLLAEAGGRGVAGVAAPSANRFGRVSPTSAAHVVDGFGPSLAVLDGGVCEVGIESTIIDCTGKYPALLRPGRLTSALIEAALGRPLALPGADRPRAPGTLASHYATAARIRLFEPPLAGDAPGGPGQTVGLYSRVVPTGVGWLHRAMPYDAVAVARELFAVLREFDAAGVTALWVQLPPLTPEWEGVRDRLLRAAA